MRPDQTQGVWWWRRYTGVPVPVEVASVDGVLSWRWGDNPWRSVEDDGLWLGPCLLPDERDRLEAADVERDGLRDVLAVEQGRHVEGVTDGWRPGPSGWVAYGPSSGTAVKLVNRGDVGAWAWAAYPDNNDDTPLGAGDADTAYDAVKAANAALAALEAR